MSSYQSFQAYDTVIILLTAPNTNDKAFDRLLEEDEIKEKQHENNSLIS
ncbi:TPA: hypothetical protein TUW63_000059 [Streptococcus equi subsp. zooepidemicus]|nr:hypothetical protein [Streptococcus equi subsp. zooepidemicus]HEL0685231.1 hypothetical protein [Streptococcus equi subsp. zooepidemicus]